MTGVSAKGSIIRRALGSRSFAAFISCWFGVCVAAYVCAGWSSGVGVTCFCFFFRGSVGAFLPVRFGGNGSVDFGRISRLFLSPDMRAERRRFCVSEESGSVAAVDFLRRDGALKGAGSGDERRTSLRCVGFATLSSGILSCRGAVCAFAVLRDVRRENWKPSSFSSYATLVDFFDDVVVVVFLLAPFKSAFTLFDTGASSSSKACLALLRRVLGRFVAMGRDVSGERAKMVDIESGVAAVDLMLCLRYSVKARA